ncbi:MAG: uracil-DNA glycosylase [Sandaracinaceae bacterium]
MPDDPRDELRELLALATEHLWAELDRAGIGVPPRPAPVRQDTLASPGPPAPAVPGATPDVRKRLAALAAEAAECTRCGLHAGRTRSVFARGNPSAEGVCVGEGPGYHEDQRGSPFVGKAGQLLDRMITAMGLGPDEIYICNVVKCRPPGNRTPNPDEAAACRPYLDGQLEAVEPRVIVALGRCAAESLGVAEPGRRWRGQWGAYGPVPVMPTYHPAYLLRNPEQKRPVWEDLQAVVARLGRPLPARGRRKA